MSNWIRIDNDTYIDDSLVTCAEYQLFIDEMRAQGKYHQPDHWTDYHFPRGQARQPILGMRPSDAVAFCEWLTRRNNDSWTYRLPTASQAQEILITKAYAPPIGYWLAEAPLQNFAWVGQIPKNPRKITSTNASHIYLSYNNELDRDTTTSTRTRARSQASSRVRNSARASALDSTIASTIVSAIDHDIDRDIDRDIKRVIELARDIDRNIELGRALDFDIALASSRNINRYLSINIASAIDRVIVRNIDRTGGIPPGIETNRYLGIDRAQKIVRRAASNIAHARDRDTLIYLYTDIFTLLERISGTSPAFEGIRLVRERVK
jgi:hypothetical protein